jgi:hypothetical protein
MELDDDNDDDEDASSPPLEHSYSYSEIWLSMAVALFTIITITIPYCVPTTSLYFSRGRLSSRTFLICYHIQTAEIHTAEKTRGMEGMRYTC